MFDPGTGSQVHDFNPGIRPSGLFWIAQIPDEALTITDRTAHLHLENMPVTDNYFFLGPGDDESAVSMDISWVAFGKVRHIRPGSSDPADPTNFAAEFRFATATGSFSGSNPDEGFTFQSNDASSEGVFAEMGTERNGSFLQ